MRMTRKKFWLTFSVVCASVVLFCAALSLIFRLQTVNVDFRARGVPTNLEAGIKDDILKSGQFSYKKNILFMNFDSNIEKIEKENPFIKVEQVIRYFPNSVKVFVSERIPRYRVKDTNDEKWYILDKDFKVLDKVTTSEVHTKLMFGGTATYYQTTVEISPSNFTITSEIGNFVKNKTVMNNMLQVTQGIYGKVGAISKAKSISFDANNNFVIVFKNSADENDEGCRVEISGLDDLKQRAYVATKLYIETLEDDPTADLSSSVIIVEMSPSGKGEYIARYRQ